MGPKLKDTIFTRRELQIAKLRNGGLKSVEIARRLKVTKADVSQTLRRLDRKIRIIETSYYLMKEMSLAGDSSKTEHALAQLTYLKAMIDSTLRKQKRPKLVCPKCKATRFVQYRNGKTVCTSCGHIIRPISHAQTVLQNLGAKENVNIFEIDLRRLEGAGNFPCPKCGTLIDPDDESDKVYQITEEVTNGDELEEITLMCMKCMSKIRLIEFTQF